MPKLIPPPSVVLDEFRALLSAARSSGDPEPTAMTVATAGADGAISARTVLLKDVDARGFVFYTNFNSNKGQDLQENPRAALLFLWKALRLPLGLEAIQVSPEGDTARLVSPKGDTARLVSPEGDAARQVQVKIEGYVEVVSDREADDYFAQRPRDSQIGAWASKQSETLDSRAELLERIAEFNAKFEGIAVPRPPHWSGFRVLPNVIEFWFGAAFRLHERVRHELVNGVWQNRALFP